MTNSSCKRHGSPNNDHKKLLSSYVNINQDMWTLLLFWNSFHSLVWPAVLAESLEHWLLHGMDLSKGFKSTTSPQIKYDFKRFKMCRYSQKLNWTSYDNLKDNLLNSSDYFWVVGLIKYKSCLFKLYFCS
jgi:hypothetical protein